MIGDGYGEYAAVPAVQCLPVPQGVSLVDAGGLPETFCTVWTNVFERMHLQPGETFLIQGGSSGIGVTSIQLAKAWGCKVLATAGSERNAPPAASSAPMSRSTTARRTSSRWARSSPAGAGVDAILDMVGGDYIPRQIDLLAHEGRLVLRRADGRHQGRGRFRRDPAQAPDRHRLDAALAQRGAEGVDRRGAAREGLAAVGARASCGRSPIASSRCARRRRRTR